MKKTIQTLAVAISLVSIASLDVSAASFDCDRASNKTEEAICSSPQVSILDENMAKLYEEVNNIYRVKQEQKDWIKYRNLECNNNEQCLKDLYSQRISELKRLTRNNNDTYASIRPVRSSRASRESRESTPARTSRESRPSRSARPVQSN